MSSRRARFAAWFITLSLGTTPFLAGCAVDEASEIVAVDEGTADLSAASKLLGEYGSGRGRYASLSLTQETVNGKRVNRFAAKQIVQCVKAPCPTLDVGGKWFAKDSTLTLYPTDAPRESYKFSQTGEKLTLKDAKGVAIAALEKVVPAAPNVASALKKHGVPNMSVEIDSAEVAKQSFAPGVKVKFDSALDKALDLFLTSDEALRGNVGEFEDDLKEECGAKADLVLCLANDSRTSIRLAKLGEDSAPYGETANEDWVFVFFVDDFTDHGYYAIVPKDGGAASVYAFN